MHWIILIALVVILFGGSGKISNLMGDVAKGIKSFKQGMADPPEEPRTINANAANTASTANAERDPVKKDQA
jgi:sec-independent protein translocase protein TatA